MDKILRDPKDPKLWELWYIFLIMGKCRILSISRSLGKGAQPKRKAEDFKLEALERCAAAVAPTELTNDRTDTYDRVLFKAPLGQCRATCFSTHPHTHTHQTLRAL